MRITFFGKRNTSSINTLRVVWNPIRWGCSTTWVIVHRSSHGHGGEESLFDSISRRVSCFFGHFVLPNHSSLSLSGVNLLPYSLCENLAIHHTSRCNGMQTARVTAVPRQLSSASVICRSDTRTCLTFWALHSLRELTHAALMFLSQLHIVE